VDPWREETHQYEETIKRIKIWMPNVSELVNRLPTIPLNYTPSEEGTVAIQVSLLVLNDMAFANQAVDAFMALWEKGIFATISLPTRLIYELWGAVHYARQTIVQMHKTGNVPKALEKSKRLTLGARSEVQLPWGGITQEKSINVMDFIDSLQDDEPQAKKIYNFLCESCHPSFLRLTMWSLMGPHYGNWSNKRFSEHAHSLITDTLKYTEHALQGISLDTLKTLELALPYIEKDIKSGE
jgi:hypothetical protein